jgi:hypothetical protein
LEKTMQSLNDAVLGAVQGAPLDDYGQRSAIGIARSWIDNGHKPIEREKNPADKYVHRDDLAEDLVVILEGHAREDAIEALQYARTVINAPFRDPGMNGQMVKQNILKPGHAAKNGAEQ